MSKNEPIRSKVDPDLPDEERAEKYLASCKHYLHPENEECWLGEKLNSSVHDEYMTAMGLKGLTPRDVIYPLEHGYYKYLTTFEILVSELKDHKVRYTAKYEKYTNTGGEK
jgi:hypothetical protein